MYWHIQELLVPANVAVSCVAEAEAILLYLTGI
jgi:hypothetical protein